MSYCILDLPLVQDVKPLGLLDLPPEIWSHICKLAVLYEEPIMIMAVKGPYRRSLGGRFCSLTELCQQRKMLTQPGIPRVCRAVREECLSTYYSSNFFYGDNYRIDAATKEWLNVIGSKSRIGLRQFICKNSGPAFVLQSFRYRSVRAHDVGQEDLNAMEAHGIELSKHPEEHRLSYYRFEFTS